MEVLDRSELEIHRVAPQECVVGEKVKIDIPNSSEIVFLLRKFNKIRFGKDGHEFLLSLPEWSERKSQLSPITFNDQILPHQVLRAAKELGGLKVPSLWELLAYGYLFFSYDCGFKQLNVFCKEDCGLLDGKSDTIFKLFQLFQEGNEPRWNFASFELKSKHAMSVPITFLFGS